MSCGGAAKDGIFMHPPYKDGVGYSFALLAPIDLPAAPKAALRCRIGKRDGSDPGDGILFRIAVVDRDGVEETVSEQRWSKHGWSPLQADLAAWAGQRVRIKLICDVGPADNSSGDWGCWADLRVESAEPILALSVHDKPVQLRYAPGPYPLKDLTIERLRRAKSGRLHFQGIGLQRGGRYISFGSLNDVPVGELPHAGGSEREGTWGDAVMPLTPQTLAALRASNRFKIANPGQDCFKIRRFWLELELEDGRKCSSQVTTATITQPPDWLYVEGTAVPFGKDIELEIKFPMKQ
jgi:hypothetical protein